MGKLKESSEKFWHVIDKALTGWSILLMGTMAVMVVLSVIMRYVFNLTYVWSEELIVYLFIATTYFGSILCVMEKEHIDIPYFWELASDAGKCIMEIFVAIVNISIQIGLAYFSFTWIEKTGSSLTTGMYIPFYTVYLMFPVCFVLMAMYTFRRIEKNIIPCIKARIQSNAAWNLINVLFLGLYTAALCGLAYIYFQINGIERIAVALKPVMMTIVFTIFSIMFAACFMLVLIYAVNRVICLFKKESIKEMGGGE